MNTKQQWKDTRLPAHRPALSQCLPCLLGLPFRQGREHSPLTKSPSSLKTGPTLSKGGTWQWSTANGFWAKVLGWLLSLILYHWVNPLLWGLVIPSTKSKCISLLLDFGLRHLACLNWLVTRRLEMRRSLGCLVQLASPSWTPGFALRKAWLAGSLLLEAEERREKQTTPKLTCWPESDKVALVTAETPRLRGPLFCGNRGVPRYSFNKALLVSPNFSPLLSFLGSLLSVPLPDSPGHCSPILDSAPSSRTGTGAGGIGAALPRLPIAQASSLWRQAQCDGLGLIVSAVSGLFPSPSSRQVPCSNWGGWNNEWHILLNCYCMLVN